MGFLFDVVLAGIFFGFRALIYWLIDSKGLPLRQAWKLGEDQQRIWKWNKWQYRISGRELIIRLVAGVMTAALLFGLGYAVYRLVPKTSATAIEATGIAADAGLSS